jgi:hypothetical protein
MTAAKWYRSWPMQLMPGMGKRPYVVDTLPRLLMLNQDYGTVDWPDHDLFMLEWDIALDAHGKEGLELFASEDPDSIAVASYMLVDGSRLTTGMGCIYLPTRIISEFKKVSPTRWHDGALWQWYVDQGYKWRVADHGWLIRPQHLNT